MDTVCRTIGNNLEENEEIYNMAADLLRKGELVAFPTETVYGLGGNALDAAASKKIYAAKGRPSDNPLIVHIAGIEALDELCSSIPEVALKLAGKFWPGPLTMIFPKKANVPYETTGGLDTVAIRMPGNEVALRLIEVSGIYIAAPSANLSGRPSPTKASHVMQDMNGRIPLIIDGGEGEIGIESTIVDVTGEVPVILRPGYITKEMIEDVVGHVEIDKAIALGVRSNEAPKAPGMKYRHYAPKGEMVIVEGGSSREITGKINSLIKNAKSKGRITGVLATEETKGAYSADYVLSVGTRKDEKTISSHLFDVLRQFDDLGVEYIVSEGFPRDNVGYAIMNRLLKAAAGKIIKADESEE
ncbi:MAG: L-threonylcarbamoyladenylate synthase [Lachnospiraceae bacterium]